MLPRTPVLHILTVLMALVVSLVYSPGLSALDLGEARILVPREEIRSFLDESGTLGPSQALGVLRKQQGMAGTGHEYGYSGGTVWALFSLVNEGDSDGYWVLADGHGIELVRLYEVNASGALKDLGLSGYGVPQADRPMPGPRAAFTLGFPHSKGRTYLAALQSTTSLKVHLEVSPLASHHAQLSSDTLVQGLFYGLLMAFFILVLLLQRRKQVTIWLVDFSIVVLGVALINLYGQGYGDWFIWRDWPVVNRFVYPLSFALISVFALQMLRHFFDVRSWSGRLDLLLRVSVLAQGVYLCAVIYLLPPSVQSMSISLLIVYFIVAFGVTVLRALKKGIEGARNIGITWLLFLSTSFLNVLSNLGVIPPGIITLNVVQFSIFPVLLLLVWSFRIRFTTAQEELSELKNNLERRIQDQTLELTETNLQLQGVLARLRETQQEMVEGKKLEALASLVAGLAHELNTPLGNSLTVVSALQARLDSLESRTLSPAEEMTRGSLPLLERNIQRSIKLVQSFKSLALEGDDVGRQVVYLQEVLEQTKRSLAEQIIVGKVEFVLRVEPGLKVMANQERLVRLFTILAENAMRHGFGIKPGLNGITVVPRSEEWCIGGRRLLEVDARILGDNIMISMGNNGRGLDPEVAVHIFEPFRTSDRGGGSAGLGLSIARSIVLGDLRGRINIDSIDDASRGWRFIVLIELPLAEHPQDPVTARHQKA